MSGRAVAVGLGGRTERTTWAFLTNHTHVLLCLADDPGIRLRDIASRVGITERATQSIVADLANAGYVTRSRVGRRNTYAVNANQPLPRAPSGQLTVGGLLAFLRSGDLPLRPPTTRPATTRPALAASVSL